MDQPVIDLRHLDRYPTEDEMRDALVAAGLPPWYSGPATIKYDPDKFRFQLWDPWCIATCLDSVRDQLEGAA